jgi:stress responsive alpha/beta barrel protein
MWTGRRWLAGALACGVLTMLASSGLAAEAPTSKVLKHLVLYKFKDDLSPAQIEEVIAAFCALPRQIETVIDFEAGTNVSVENKSEGFTHCFVVTFRDEAGRAAYLAHPAHDAYVKIVRDRRDKVIVFDYWAQR